jgi:hypothetical protein
MKAAMSMCELFIKNPVYQETKAVHGNQKEKYQNMYYYNIQEFLTFLITLGHFGLGVRNHTIDFSLCVFFPAVRLTW